MMNSLVVYYSRFGNTKQVAEAIAEVLSSKGSARVLDMRSLSVSDLKDLDLLVAGVPTHRMNLPDDVRVLLRRFPRRILRSTYLAAFDTSYKMSRWLEHFTAARKLMSRLRRLGGKRIVRPETFHVVESQGPLYEGEVERAKAWASSIVTRVKGRVHR